MAITATEYNVGTVSAVNDHSTGAIYRTNSIESATGLNSGFVRVTLFASSLIMLRIVWESCDVLLIIGSIIRQAADMIILVSSISYAMEHSFIGLWVYLLP